jgi:hypothetical protein
MDMTIITGEKRRKGKVYIIPRSKIYIVWEKMKNKEKKPKKGRQKESR